MTSHSRHHARTLHDVSAGGVTIRWIGGALEVLLVGRETPPRWEIPKGTPLEGESLEHAAVREVSEETGLQVRIIELLGEISYWFSVGEVRHHKTVRFFLMEPTGGDTANHDSEHDFSEWLTADEALRRISFPNEATTLEEAIRRVPALSTVPAHHQRAVRGTAEAG